MPGYHLVGSCNGLHCGVSEILEGYRVCFWNKATRVISRESPTLSFSPGIGRRTMFGFGYDPSSDKYKVVAIALTMLSLDVSEKTEMKVHGAGDTSWRNLKGFPVLWTLPKVGGVYLSGTLNWVFIKGKETIHSEIVIISIDLEKETCRSLFLPDDFCFVDTNIGVFRDSLCVWQDSNTHLGLWQMRKFGDDKSWIQLINFSYLHLNIRPYEEKSMILPLCMSNNGDFFMLKFTRNADDEYQTILYNQGDDDIDCPYARSLISLQGIEEKTAKLKGSEKALVARHEASHAVVGTAVANLLAGQPHVEALVIRLLV
ncbi:ATP-dependent zinc metalloprotease FTSH, chloroplastic [Glycine soja]|uniref:ATP-dependent zinc metalloprotease FTSH, chloroplastic n=1 Tax=Glycine soja TaxID=3848 RepID=A0A445EXQ2_GLYSO|nr:ATP-dependent zinc metalloprotease FTSH, chloroplastic [Glycine soja]